MQEIFPQYSRWNERRSGENVMISASSKGEGVAGKPERFLI